MFDFNKPKIEIAEISNDKRGNLHRNLSKRLVSATKISPPPEGRLTKGRLTKGRLTREPLSKG